LSPLSLDDWLSLLEKRHPIAVDLGLERCGVVWRRMGSPTPGKRRIVVAGTNGKGSTVATLCALLTALGYRCGSYTSPHISRYNERVRIEGRAVTNDELVAAFEHIEGIRGEVSLSYFEFGTLAAFRLLAAADLDFAVLEIGLGGRLDAVNLADADCAVITPIGYDHQEYLGDDLDSIGREKAGIIRPGRPLICGEPEPPQSVLLRAKQLAAPTERLGREFTVEPTASGMRFRKGGLQLELPAPMLDGEHQRNNAATALAAVLELLPAAASRPAALARGLRSVRLDGRLERVHEHPTVWLDVGHNEMAAAAVAATLQSPDGAGSPGACRCVLGMLVDKDANGTAAALAPLITHWYCCGLPGPRGQSGASLAGRIESAVDGRPVAAFESVAGGLRAALREAAAGDAVLVFGSFLTVEEAKRVLSQLPGDADSG
jgi:dihydrofolate synthase/folylpolyglutamate synthase